AGTPESCVATIWSGNRLAVPADIVPAPTLFPRGRDCGLIAGTSIAATFRFDSGAIGLMEGYVAEAIGNERMAIEARGDSGRLRLWGGNFNRLDRADGVYPEGDDGHIPWRPVPLPEPNGLGLDHPVTVGLVPVYRA